MPQVCRYTTLSNISVSLTAPLVSGVAGLNASSIRQQSGHIEQLFDVKNAGCDRCFKQQLRQYICILCFLLLISLNVLLHKSSCFYLLHLRH